MATALNSNGMVIVDPAIAFDSGFWHSRGNCNSAFRDIDAIVRQYGGNCQKCRVKTGDRYVVLMYRSLSRLAQRVEEVYGLYIADDQDFKLEEVEQPMNHQARANAKSLAEKQSIIDRQAEQASLLAKRKAKDLADKQAHDQWQKEQDIIARKSREDFYAQQ